MRHASPSYSTVTGITVFATERVVAETFHRFPAIAGSRGVDVSDVERVRDDMFCGRVRAVDMARVGMERPDGTAAAGRLAARAVRRGARLAHRAAPRHVPQAFSHLALVEAAARIVVPDMLEEF